MKPLLLITLMLITGCAGFWKDMGYQRHPRKWDNVEKTLAVTSWIATGADTVTTVNHLNNGGYEANPIPGRHPSTMGMVSYMISTQITAHVIAHFFPAYRKALLGVKTTVNTGCALHNENLD